MRSTRLFRKRFFVITALALAAVILTGVILLVAAANLAGTSDLHRFYIQAEPSGFQSAGGGISLGEALSPACREKKDKKPWVVLTFDDGYEDFYTDAFPVLSEYGYTSLLYLVPGRIGSGEVFWWDRDIGESALMSWEQLDNLKKSGLVEFGSHSMSHPDFDRINRDDARQELLQSKKVLEGRLSMPVRHFAYPRGIIAHQDIVGELYETAVSIFDGSSGAAHCPLGNVTRLVRMPVQRSDGPVLFAARLKGWLCAEGFIKRLIGKH